MTKFLLISLLPLIFSCSTAEIKKDNITLTQSSSKEITTSTQESKHDFNIYRNEQVDRWVQYFSVKDKERFSRFLNRGAFYKEVIQTTLEEEELPYILYYLPLIESGFNYKAHSHAGAVGPWQFIKGTGKRYGLEINSYVDERQDPILSTEAATKYLNDLYNVFNSWELAIAAYNCGEMRVLRAIMKGKTRNFWELSKRKLLPRETRNYVPKFLAAAYVGENLKKYGLSISETNSFPDVESVEIPGGVTLASIANVFDMDFDSLKKMNLALKRNITPGWVKTHSVWLPPEKAKSFSTKIASKLSKNRKWSRVASTPRTYKVRRGDTLSSISRRYKISLNRLKRINKLKRSRIYVGQKLLVRSTSYQKVAGKKFYFVKRNDSLGRVAQNFGLSLWYLKRLNGLHSNTIHIGQKLDVTHGVRSFNYRVRKGDNLNLIARLYKTSVKRLRTKNNLRSSRIYAGQLLKI